MSNVARVAGQAANTLVKPLNVEDVFSTYLYEGNGSTQTITNGIDLDGEGGLVWIKNRDFSDNHMLIDTERGNEYLISNENFDEAGTGTSFVTTSTGFNIVGSSFDDWNASGENYASWTWRKAPKFFDVVTYTGTGSAQTISHNLGSVPGMIIVKSTSNSFNWVVYHRGTDATAPEDYITYLDLTNARANIAGAWNDTAPTSTEFTVGTTSAVNFNGGTFVAYLFAHNDGDAEFGPTGDQDIIKCGSYTGTGSAGNEVDLGFEPQWVMIKRAVGGTGDWYLSDAMRGIPTDGSPALLRAHSSAAEDAQFDSHDVTSTGFKLKTTASAFNGSGSTYIYIAIRRGPMAVPESATDVFDVGDASETGSTAPEYEGGFTVDMALKRIQSASQPNYIFDRLRGGNSLITNGFNAESAFGAAKFDYMDGYYNGTSSSSTNWSAMWKRAPNYFDVVAYTGDGTSNRAIKHNLDVAPEMIWVKARNIGFDWVVKHKDLGRDELTINATTSAGGNLGANFWGTGTDTATVFHTANSGTNRNTNGNNDTYIAYLFASLAGVSKVGSYTGSASAQTIDCGFTAGAKFVLIKRTDSTGSWVVWDTNRGIVAGNDPYFKLETNEAPTTTDDYIDPHNSGFTLAGGIGFINTSGGSYIFYAIA